MTQSTDELERLMREATPGPWHHVQAFESVPAVRTIHGKVPGQRVDYVSTWPGPGTPKGHRVVIPMETVTEEGIVRTATSADMALICAAVNALPELVERVKRLEEALKPFAEARLESWGQRTQGVGDYLTRVWIKTAPNIAFAQARATITKDTP